MPDTQRAHAEPLAGPRSLADIITFEQTPWQERLPAQNTYELLCRACERHPEKTALRFVLSAEPGSAEYTVDYKTLKERVTQAANAFYRAGIVPGKAVTLLLPNLPETHFALLGAQAAGIASPVNPMLEIDHIVSIVNETRAEALVAFAPGLDVGVWNKAVAVAERCPSIRTLFVAGVDAYVDVPTRVLFAQLAAASALPARGDVKIVAFDQALMAERADALASGRRIAPTDICAYFHTGGTTGVPKIAMHSHLNEAFVASMLNVVVPGPNVIICGLPLFHVNGAMVTGLGAFCAGWEVVMLTPGGYRGKAVLQNFWRLVDRFRANSFSGVPTVYSMLADLPRDGADISSLRFAFCGAAPLPLEVARSFEAAAGIQLYQGYGMTEAACISSIDPVSATRRLGSVGLRLPHQQLKIWQIDSAGHAVRECAPTEIGVIGVCGPNVFPGYLRAGDNDGVWLKPGWLNTGDLGYLDFDGYLHLTGRAKDLIIRGGHNIDPAMIEDALQRHPAVALVAAVGQPDLYSGELPVAYVTLKHASKSLTGEELRAFAANSIPERAAVPVRIEVVTAMALTAVGKIAKAELRMRAAEYAYRTVLAKVGLQASVEVRADLQKGTLAVTHCAPQDEHRVRLLLEKFPLPVEVQLISPVQGSAV